jgi:hypothetical protein
MMPPARPAVSRAQRPVIGLVLSACLLVASSAAAEKDAATDMDDGR